MSEINNLDVGDRIKNIRLAKGYTMESFGEMLATSKGTVNNWEKGRNLPNKENLKSIADLANISVNEILYGKERDYVYSIIPTDDSELLETTYFLYLLRYEENSYQIKEKILEVFEFAKDTLSESKRKANIYLTFIHAHVVNLLIGKLHEGLESRATHDELIEIVYATLLENLELIRYLEQNKADIAKWYPNLGEDIKKRLESYHAAGIYLDMKDVNEYIKEQVKPD